MKKFLIYILLLITTIFIVGHNNNKNKTVKMEISNVQASINTSETLTKNYTNYVSLGVPNVNSSFKAWMDYRAVTNKQSPQYKFIHAYGWCDNQGFMRASGERDLGIPDDYYLIALGSYYGTTIGTKYRITLNTGNVFYGVLADCKANMHTNSTNQYSRNNNIIEFIVDSKQLNKEVKRMGSANVHMPLNGCVAKIEKIDFVYE